MQCENPDTIRKVVRERYGKIAGEESSIAVEPRGGACCGSGCAPAGDLCGAIGYSLEEMESVPRGSNMGLGCGNPKAHASLKAGETVLDLGCGGGFDCFLAAREVGEGGRVIGVDMTPEMLSRARENAKQSGFPNVEFRLGEIEHLPVEDNSVDVVISNCVVNLSPEKRNVLREAFRVLRPGGRLAISDVLATKPLPDHVKNDLDLLSACIGGAETIQSVEEMLAEAGFERIHITPREESRRIVKEWLPDSGIEDYVVSAMIEAVKPLNAGPSAVDTGSGGASADPSIIRKRAHGYFLSGYHCAEVILRTTMDTFGREPDPAAVRCASAFGGGVGGTTEELCGAFTGGVMALGYLLGRDNPGESLSDCGALVKEFKLQLSRELGTLNCATILGRFENHEEAQMECVRLTARAAQILADLLVKTEPDRGISLSQYLSQSRSKVKLGCCPFSTCACITRQAI